MSSGAVVDKGEVAGSFLLGLIGSFSCLNIIPDELNLEGIEPEQWYPYQRLVDAIGIIERTVPNSEIILFYAGINFIRIWYENGPGKTMIASGMDWLHANQSSGGYNSVVRGGDKNEIGWCLLQSIDAQSGLAVYENVMPLPPDFVRGIFYGGCMIFDDMEYVHVDATLEPYGGNVAFTRFILTVHFRLKSEPISRALERKIGKDVALSALSSDEIETLIWRNRGMQIKIELEMAYHAAIGALLADAITAVRKTAGELARRNTEVEHLANHDVLTGLPSRRLATIRLASICQQEAGPEGSAAALFIDLDGFKVCNDRFGHDAGDHVLKAVAARLVTCSRDKDMVARLGGDEFLVVVQGMQRSRLAATARQMIDAIAEPIAFKDNAIRVGASIGIAFADQATKPEHLLSRADKAMYSVKSRGKNDFSFFEDLAA